MSVTVLLCGVTARAYVLCVRLRYNVWRYGSPLTPPNSTLPPSNMRHRRSRPSPGPSGTIPRRRPLRGAAAQPARPPELATQEGRYRLRPRHPHRHTDLAPCCGGTLVSAALRRRQPVPPYLSPSCVSNNIKWLMNYLTAHDVSTCSACRAHVPLNHPIGDTGAVLGPGHPACLRIGAARMSGRSASHGPLGPLTGIRPWTNAPGPSLGLGRHRALV